MSIEYERMALPRLSSLEATRILTEQRVKGWMRRVKDFSQTKKGQLVMQLIAGLEVSTTFGVAAYTKELHQLVHRSRDFVGSLEGPPTSFEVDEGFQEVGFSPQVIRTGVQEAFGSLVVTNVDRIQYGREHKPVPATYRGPGRYIAGECTSSEAQGARSQILLTVDGFHGQSVESSVHTLFHEIAHALDPENADKMDMPEPVATALREALQEIVRGNQTTLYGYVNGYEGGFSTEEDEDALQRQELFAELVADGFTMPVLPAGDPLLALPVLERFEQRLATKYGKTVAETRPYARIMAILADWRGQDFFERGQQACERMIQGVQATRDRQGPEMQDRLVMTELERLVIPSLSVALERWSQVREQGEREESSLLEGFFFSADTDFLIREIRQREHRAEAERLLSTTAGAISDARRAYDESYLREVHDPGLRAIFLDLVGSLDAKHLMGPLEGLREVMRDNFINPPSPADRATTLNNIHLNVEAVNNVLRKAEQIAPMTDREGMAFRAAVLAWVEGETAGSWYRELDQRLPQLTAVRRQINQLVPERSVH